MNTRADIAHLGATGYELDSTLLTDEEKESIKEHIQNYKEMAHLVLSADLYRTENPFEDGYFGFNLVAKDKSEAVFTCYRRFNREDKVKFVYPRGLDPDKRYYIPEREVTLSGATIMNAGLQPYFSHRDFSSRVFRFKEVK